MLDTIVLLLTQDMFEIENPNKFIPSAHWIFSENRRQSPGMYSRQNPTKKDLRNGIYKPRLMLAPRVSLTGRYEIILKIELSLPKLLFGNSFEELQYKDRLPVIMKLVDVLKQMGVITTADIIAYVPVSAIHYSKNIPLTDGSTPYHFINKIKKANIKLSLDVNQTDYRNEGHSYKWHCNSYEIVFYDKIKDLEKAKTSSKRALEKDNEIQLNFLKQKPSLRQGFGGRHAFYPASRCRESQRRRRKKLEILRMEVRLNKRQKIRQLFNKLGIKTELTFKKLFKPAISKKILLHYLDELESKRPLLLDYKTSNYKALLADLIFNNPDLGPKRVLQMYGLKHALDCMNPRELREMFSTYSARSWYRLMGDVNKIKLPAIQRPFGIIRRCLVKFKPLRLKKLKN